ncbi:MAG: CRISPR-associated protein Csx14 [Deltaproteobacteria bacterium]|nr:CRISPR-associated protein Csx14 [Deltaproteobacteria bacterium]
MQKNMTQQVLIATLGSEPQVVTLVLDLLRAKGYPIAEVVVVHTVGEAVRPALERLAGEFALLRACGYRPVPVESEGWPVADFLTEADTAGLLRTMYRTVLAEKRAGRLVHLSIAGGRKPMAVYGMVVAQLLFDEDDRVWHLLSEGWQPGNERVMHMRPGDRVWLVPVPVLRWSAVSPVLTELALREDPWEAIQTQRVMQREEERRRKREFVEYWLTPAERELVRLACKGLDNAAIARQLHKSEKTVANQFTSIYEKLHEWRGFRKDIPVSRAVLVAEFAVYFAMGGTEQKIGKIS